MNTHDIDIELPAEFRSGNDIPVTQATIKRERMEEIIRDAIEADRKRTAELLKNPVHVHTNMCRGIIAPITFDMLAHVLGEEATNEWLRKRRGAPVLVGWAVGTTGGGLLHASKYTEHEARDAGYSLPLYRLTAPQPAEPCVSSVSDKTTCGSASGDCDSQRAEPVKVPSDEVIMDEIYAVCPDFDEAHEGIDRSQVITAFRTLLARYGQPAQPAAIPVGIAAPAGPMYPPGKTIALFDAAQVPNGTYVFISPVAAQSSVPEPLKYGREWKDHYVTGWNNCRAAMLAAEQPQQECGCCGRSDGCDPDCDASQAAANDDPTPEEEEAWQQMERRS